KAGLPASRERFDGTVRDDQIYPLAGHSECRAAVLNRYVPRGIDVPVNTGAMRALAADEIGNGDQVVVRGKHAPPMFDRRVPVVPRVEVVAVLLHVPLFDVSVRDVRPMK